MLKNLLVLPLLALPLCGLAWAPGAYVGAGIGADTTDFDVTSYPQKTGDFDVINRTQLAAQGVLGNLFAGYAWTYNWFYIAAELNGNLSSATHTSSNEEKVHNSYSITKDKIDETWGVGLLPGVLLPQDTLLFARVGYVDGRYKVETSDVSLAPVDSWLNGLRLGLGVAKKINNHWNLRLEYSHISYQQQSSTVVIPSDDFMKKTDVTPDSNQAELGVMYSF